jgi:nitrogen fixation NifU-like protein
MESDRLMEHFESPYHCGRLIGATHVASVRNPACGDEISIEVKFSGSAVSEAWFQARGCAVCRAAASVLCEMIEGGETQTLLGLSGQQYLAQLGFTLTPRRQLCALLPFRALKTLLYEREEHSPQANEPGRK